MAGAFRKDIWRTIKNSRKRFVAILVICALGVTMVTGLRASCSDLRDSADTFFDNQHLYDISIQSTLGLTADDVSAIADVDGVDQAEGTWEEDTYTNAGTKRISVGIKAISPSGINEPYLVSGELPTQADQVAVTQSYLELSGAQVGDTVTLEDGDDEVFNRSAYTITGVVIDPAELTNPTGTIAIRASASPDCSFFVTPDAVKADSADVFTALYVTIAGAQDISSYSDEYTALVDSVTARIEDLQAEREQARTDSIKADAHATIDDEEADANQQFADAEQQFADAQAKIDDGWTQLNDSKDQIASGKQELEAGAQELEDQAAQLADGKAQLEAGQKQIDDGYAAIEAAREPAHQQALQQLNDRFDQELAQQQADLKATLDQALAAGVIDKETYDQQYAEGMAAINQRIEQAHTEQINNLNATFDATYDAEVAPQKEKLAQAQQELDARAQQITDGEAAIASGRATLESSRAQLESGAAQIASGEEELRQGQQELDDQRAEYETTKADALDEIAKARADVDAIEGAQWYVQTRESNTGYSSIESDASSIEAIGMVFPVVFIVIAVLIALTTITRMVEEERSLIGTYKSLGYSRHTILSKYLIYALAACIIGGLLGELFGFVLFPLFLFYVFQTMYLIPEYLFAFDALYGIGSVLFFILGVGGAAILACRSELKQTPAALMRPKAPKAGSRIFLERITPLWSRMSFLNKVTARNIFRYKKRFLMTIVGIMGCMALLVCGFAIRDSVLALSPMQYNDINRYDVLAVVNADDYDDSLSQLEQDNRISAIQPLMVDTVTLSTETGEGSGEGDASGTGSNAGSNSSNTADEQSLQLFVVPDGASLDQFINLRTDADSPVQLTDEGMLLTRNAAEILGVADGDTIHVDTTSLDKADVPIDHVVDNYLGNAAYLTQSTYESLFGDEMEPNGFYLNLASEDATEQEAFANDLATQDNFMSVSSTAQMSGDFSQSFSLINTVVYVIIVLAAALAFVVLFTLSTTNISERVRELATIKVLGFRKREVNHYVNKETWILTGLGILVGIPAGYAFSQSLTYVLKMPSIYFAVTIEPISYVIAAVLTLLFAWIVSLLSNRALAKIDMIEALKSVE